MQNYSVYRCDNTMVKVELDQGKGMVWIQISTGNNNKNTVKERNDCGHQGRKKLYRLAT